jgi:RNA polymerase sigma-70 factor (ECF subfamily)
MAGTLSMVFQAAGGPATPEGMDLEAALSDFVARARAGAPDVTLDDERLVRHLAARLDADEPLAEQLARLHAGDLYLCCACLDGDAAALARFDQLHVQPMGPVIARVDGAGDLVAEVTQRLRERLLAGAAPRLAQYNGRGPLAGWVRTAALRLALNVREQVGTRRAVERSAGSDVVAALDPELEIMKRTYKEDVEAALKAALQELGPEPRQLLRLHFMDGVTLEQIARVHGVNRSTISRRVSAARAELLHKTRQALAALQLSDDSLDSLLRLVESQLDMSLSELRV